MVSTGEFIGRRVGRFTITSHLASGGMAELFIARQEAVGGFEKDLVLKMLQARYAENPRVVEMFLDEARLAAKLNHQNIVHVYDVDEADGLRYIAMEYIHGETVTDIVRRSISAGGFLPLEHALHIVSETAAGLAYAHESRDLEGRPARIVHRDVSPSNILVTYEGLTKIVDFGIARVQDQIREESGMRPGKVSYMSPEQVRGEPADHRSDIFSLGIILYELTVGRRLWRGAAEVVMRRIVEELIPPPTYVRRDYPPALELIVMKALERRPADRYQSAADLQHDLSDFMEDAGLKSGSRRLSEYMKDLFAPRSDQPEDSDWGQRATGTGTGTDPALSAVAGAVDSDDEVEELDFDRRAPLMMRMEARLEEDAEDGARGSAVVSMPAPNGSSHRSPGTRSSRTLPGPPPAGRRQAPLSRNEAAAASSPSGRHQTLEETPTPGPTPPLVPGAGPPSRSAGQFPAGIAGNAGGPHGSRTAAAIGSVSDGGRPSSPSSPGIVAGPVGAGTPPVSAPAPLGGSEPVSGALRWAIVLLLAAALVVVFLATR